MTSSDWVAEAASTRATSAAGPPPGPPATTPTSTTTERGSPASSAASTSARSGSPSAPPPSRQQPQARTDRDLEPGEGVGGHRGARGEPLGEARAVGLGHPERGGQVAAEVDEQGAVVVARPDQ